MNRRKIVPAMILVLIVGIVSAHGQQSAGLKAGDMAPDFTLIDQNRKPVTLSDFRGKQNVVLAFYALAFTGG